MGLFKKKEKKVNTVSYTGKVIFYHNNGVSTMVEEGTFESDRFALIFLPFLHTEPAEKSVHIVYQKDDKANDDGNVRYIGNSRHYPHYNEDNVIYRICKREKHTPAKCQTNGKEACTD